MGIRNKYPFNLSYIYDSAFKNRYTVSKEDNKYIIGIGLTSRCNFSCPICYYHNSNYDSDVTDIPLELLQTIFKNCGRLQRINFALEGEPFCYHHIFKALDCAMENSESLGISTNGSLLSREKLQILSGYKFSLFSFSIDAADEASYARFRRGGQLSKFVHNAGMATEQLGSPVVFNTVLFQQNLKSVLGLPELAARTGVSVISLVPLRAHEGSFANGITPAKHEDLQCCLEEMTERASKYNIELVFDGFSGNHKIAAWLARNGLLAKNPASGKDKCIIPWFYTSILSSGKLFPCCGDFQPERIISYTFDDIFNHEYLVMLRGSISQKRYIEPCDVCFER